MPSSLIRTLLIDMDSVICDLMTEWHERYNRDYQDNLSVEKLSDWHSEWFVKPDCGRKIYDYLDQPGLFASLRPIPGAIEVLSRLVTHYDILIVTSSRTNAYSEKERWVTQHIPFIGPHNLVFTHRKDMVYGDLLFDDAPHNLKAFAATGRLAVAMDYPYNRHVACPHVQNWFEFEQLLTERYGGAVS